MGRIHSILTTLRRRGKGDKCRSPERTGRDREKAQGAWEEMKALPHSPMWADSEYKQDASGLLGTLMRPWVFIWLHLFSLWNEQRHQLILGFRQASEDLKRKSGKVNLLEKNNGIRISGPCWVFTWVLWSCIWTELSWIHVTWTVTCPPNISPLLPQ